MTKIGAARITRSVAVAWMFRLLIVAAAAFMAYSWFEPWWSTRFSAIPGRNHMVLHPWGIEAVGRVRRFSDNGLYDMPAFFAPFVWTYFTVCMLALAASLIVKKQVVLGRITLSVASILIGLVGLSYLATVGIAYGVGELRAVTAGTNFIGRSTLTHPDYSGDITMTSQLEIGYWLAVSAGVVLVGLALLRGLIVGKPKAWTP